jgi:hypothetical protein
MADFLPALRLDLARSLAVMAMLAACLVQVPVAAQGIPFQHTVIDADGPSDPHCKTIGDINGDGYLDAVASRAAGAAALPASARACRAVVNQDAAAAHSPTVHQVRFRPQARRSRE